MHFPLIGKRFTKTAIKVPPGDDFTGQALSRYTRDRDGYLYIRRYKIKANRTDQCVIPPCAFLVALDNVKL